MSKLFSKNDSEEYVLVPRRHIIEIELARRKLYEMLDPLTTEEMIKLQSITEPMWNIANIKYLTFSEKELKVFKENA